MTPRVVYILGAGRSGSTVLERLLASADRVAGAGELHILWRAPFARLRCACAHWLLIGRSLHSLP